MINYNTLNSIIIAPGSSNIYVNKDTLEYVVSYLRKYDEIVLENMHNDKQVFMDKLDKITDNKLVIHTLIDNYKFSKDVNDIDKCFTAIMKLKSNPYIGKYINKISQI